MPQDFKNSKGVLEKVFGDFSEALIRTPVKISNSFDTALNIIEKSKGKLITTGLGKSGYIARKAAATFSSTGTSACFLHPSEALHGDLGLLSEGDIVLAFAFGGETKEVIEVLKFAKRIGLPIIGITGKLGSSLARLADVVLDGSVEREACRLNLAPTTSTLVAMAIGDALAIGMMDRKGFKEQDFAQYHPGGSLGKKLSLVKDHIRPLEEMVLLEKEDKFLKVLESTTSKNFGISAVLGEQGRLAGCISDGDLRRALKRYQKEIFGKVSRELMNSSPKIVAADSLSIEAVKIMEKYKITSVFIVESYEDMRLQGMVRFHDLFEAGVC